jgi:hypothetical protein
VIDLTLREVQSRIATLNIATPGDFQRQLGEVDPVGWTGIGVT